MGYITNQWLKHSSQGRGHYPIRVEVESLIEQSKWKKDHNVAVTLVFDKENVTKYTCGECGFITSKYGSAFPPPICAICNKQLTFSDEYREVIQSEYQQAYLTKEDIGKIIKDLFLASSVDSNRKFLREVIPNISDEFKFELIKLLLNDEKNNKNVFRD